MQAIVRIVGSGQHGGFKHAARYLLLAATNQNETRTTVVSRATIGAINACAQDGKRHGVVSE